jgi:hypothetical protein
MQRLARDILFTSASDGEKRDEFLQLYKTPPILTRRGTEQVREKDKQAWLLLYRIEVISETMDTAVGAATGLSQLEQKAVMLKFLSRNTAAHLPNTLIELLTDRHFKVGGTDAEFSAFLDEIRRRIGVLSTATSR